MKIGYSLALAATTAVTGAYAAVGRPVDTFEPSSPPPDSLEWVADKQLSYLGRLQPLEHLGPRPPGPPETPTPPKPQGPQVAPETPLVRLNLPKGYESLEVLGSQLEKLDKRFDSSTPEGRSATALALALGGCEVYSQGSRRQDFFTRRGGSGNNMLGFAQYNLAYHSQSINTPKKYASFTADILTGKEAMPNGRAGSNHVQALTQAVASGNIKDGQDLREFMLTRKFGGSNWQGIDDGWNRVPGLSDALVDYLQSDPAP